MSSRSTAAETSTDQIRLRPARLSDVDEIFDIWWDAEMSDYDDAPPRPRTPPTYAHEIATGKVIVAERNGRLLGFCAVVRRGEVAFLAELFIRREAQSSHLGKRLLDATLPHDGTPVCTLASRDPRALSRYVREGMQPQWPNIWLRGELADLRLPEDLGITITETRPDDPELIRWDTHISGRPRPEDLRYFVEGMAGVPLWFERDGTRVGYGFVLLGSPESPWNPSAITVGPIGAPTPDDARDCVLAATVWARSHGRALRIPVPGPHPALGPLLEAGALIVYTETFCSSTQTPIFDARSYLTSTFML